MREFLRELVRCCIVPAATLVLAFAWRESIIHLKKMIHRWHIAWHREHLCAREAAGLALLTLACAGPAAYYTVRLLELLLSTSAGISTS